MAEGSNDRRIVDGLSNALYDLNQAPQLWHNDINAFLLSLGYTQSLAYPNHYLHSDNIMILLYVDNISMSYAKAATKAGIEVKVKLSEKFKITNIGPPYQFLGIKIHRDGTAVSLG
jgi:hypothetical protein